MKKSDVLLKNGMIFDGSATPYGRGDILIREGRIAELATSIRETGLAAHTEIVDASDYWVMPGLVDIHTHMDLEVELNPGLVEVVRHGTTTVVVGNCSLGTAFGAQVRNGDNPIVDCFTRVENMPKSVLQKCVDKMDWDNTADYLEHFEHIPLGPNIAVFVPHSMLRIEVMGVNDSVSRMPTGEEHRRICALLRDALDQGYIGMSSDQIVFHYLSNDPNKDKRIPTQFACDQEIKDLVDLLRDYDRVWQTTPDSEQFLRTVKRYFWTSARLHKKPLKITALTAIDFVPAPGMWKKMLGLGTLLNSWLFKGKINFQALSTNFRIWSNGVVAPFFEELPSTRRVIAMEAEDREGRAALMRDPQWQESFRADWERISDTDTNVGISMRGTLVTFRLDMSRMFFDDSAVSAWDGDSLMDVFLRLQKWQRSGGTEGAKNAQESEAFARFPRGIDSQCDFFLNGVLLYDTGFRWWLDAANVDEDVVEQILFHPAALPGFNDSGAHITNMAFYDANLVSLKIAMKQGLDRVAHAVHRLTAEPADFLGIDTGRIRPGARADLVLIDPQKLQQYDTNQNRHLEYSEHYDHPVMVNRSDGVVHQVYIAGVRVWEEGARATPDLGARTLGQVLRAGMAA